MLRGLRGEHLLTTLRKVDAVHRENKRLKLFADMFCVSRIFLNKYFFMNFMKLTLLHFDLHYMKILVELCEANLLNIYNNKNSIIDNLFCHLSRLKSHKTPKL